MKILYQILLVIFTAILLLGCDEITGDYKQSKQNIDTTNVDTSKIVRKILLEDYTGFKCGNCPKAAEDALALAELYPGRIIIMTVHAGYFAEPTKSHPYDFRTPVGDDWDKTFKISDVGNPNGMISRIKYDGSRVISPSKWDPAIQSILNSESSMKIELTCYFSFSRKEITVDANVNYHKNVISDNQLVVAILEDSIVQYQLDYRKTPQDIQDYVHNHVFRAAMNSAWGDALGTTDIKAGTLIKKSYTYKIPEGKDWRIEKLKIVAFVHDNSTKEILQAEETDKFILLL